MKIKLQKINELLQILSDYENKNWPVKIQYAIGKNIYNLKKEQTIFEEERIKICEKLCIKKENGEPELTENDNGIMQYQFTNENLPLAHQKIHELNEIETEIDIVKIGLDTVMECGENYDNITTNDIVNLGFMIE